jgi:pimeloyl-ACP methyl ester carboxylesterase
VPKPPASACWHRRTPCPADFFALISHDRATKGKTVSSSPNPAAAFYASPAARAVAATLRGLDGLAPALGTRLALRLFFTPLPTKQRARAQALPPGWRIDALPFEGGELAVWRLQDPPPDAPRVLLVHGWAADARQMLTLAEAVRAAGLSPLLVDLPAHGRSAGWRSNLPQWSRALFALSSRYGRWHGVVGHSLGARAVAHALAQGLPAERAALLALAPPPRQFMGWFVRALALRKDLADRMAHTIEQREGMPLHTFEPGWLGARIAQPLLLVHDADDRVAPLAASEALQGAVAGASLQRTEGLGHRKLLGDLRVAAAVAAHLQGTKRS